VSYRRIDHWRDRFVGIGEVSTAAPVWVLHGLLPPGMTLVAGDPKTYKSTFGMVAASMIVHHLEMRAATAGHRPKPRKSGGSVFILPYEQSAGRLRHMYEERILKKKVKSGLLDLSFFKDPWDWRLDEPSADENVAQFILDVKPTVMMVDPWAHGHSQDENDPRSVHHLVPIRKAALKVGTAFVLVHHNSKRSDVSGASKARGTSALWAMADAGHFLSKSKTGHINIESEFKDFPSKRWKWRPP
jgi:hypothetical protein